MSYIHHSQTEQAKNARKIKSLGYHYGLECQESMGWEYGMSENFQSSEPDINEIKEVMKAFKSQNTIETISYEDLKQYKEILIINLFESNQENLKAFLDGYLDSIFSDLLKSCFEFYENKNS